MKRKQRIAREMHIRANRRMRWLRANGWIQLASGEYIGLWILPTSKQGGDGE